MEHIFDYNEFAQLARNPVGGVVWLFKVGGWVFLIGLSFWIIAYIWLMWRRSIYDRKRRFIMLAVDIPRDNLQTPKATEQMITHLSGAHDGPKREDKWVEGRIEESFGLEIVSIGGYIQFVIHLHEKFRDLVESAIYAQYPDAEITEIEDYTEPFRKIKFPNDEWNMWSCELVPTNKEFYPIRTYPEFEHPLTQEFKDPLAAMLENMSKLGPDEQLWFQIIVTNTDTSWVKNGEILVKKLIGARDVPKEKRPFWSVLIDMPLKFFGFLSEITTPKAIEEGQVFEPPSLMQHISPGTRNKVEAIEEKLSKVGFSTHVRFLYIAKKESYSGQRVDEMFGAIKQFNTLDMNGLKPSKKMVSKVYGLFKNFRKAYRNNILMRLYRLRGRAYTPGYFGNIMNSEELATLYHFPLSSVKAPLVKKTEAKRAEPPMSLPIE